jgi:hypothetical protein
MIRLSVGSFPIPHNAGCGCQSCLTSSDDPVRTERNRQASLIAYQAQDRHTELRRRVQRRRILVIRNHGRRDTQIRQMELYFASPIARVHGCANRVSCDRKKRHGSMQRVGEGQRDPVPALDPNGPQRVAHGDDDAMKRDVIEKWSVWTSKGNRGGMIVAVGRDELK